MVRPRSATPLSAGSNPAVTSKTKIPALAVGIFVLEIMVLLSLGFPSFARKPGHILTAERVELARKRQGERIFVKDEYPAVKSALAVGIFVFLGLFLCFT